MLKIGLTGGIGAGKSTVREFLDRKGAASIDADAVGHQVYRPHSEAWEVIVATWGPSIVQPSGEIDRKKLGQIVFETPQELAKLNEIMYPRIAAAIGERLEQLRQEGVEVAVVEAAILVEAGWDRLVDEVWVVVSPDEVVVPRLAGRAGMTPEQVGNRVRSQMPVQEKVNHANVVIENTGTIEDLHQLLEGLWQERRAKKGQVERHAS